jgi:2-keto-4-pentenoate hydratase
MNDSAFFENAAERLLERRRVRGPFANIDKRGAPLSMSEGYRIQTEYRQRLAVGSGAERGFKIGLGDVGLQAKLGITEPIVGSLFERSAVRCGGTASLQNFNHLGIECEIALVMASGGLDAGTRLGWADVASVHAAFELIDNRGASLDTADAASIVADNSWNAGFVIGEGIPPADFLDIPGTPCKVLSNRGAILDGHVPAPDTILAAANWLATFLGGSRPLQSGDIILTGNILGPIFPSGEDRFHFLCEGLPGVDIAIVD